MANETIKTIQPGRVFKILDVTTNPVGTKTSRLSVGRAKSMEVYLKGDNAAAAPTITTTVNAVRPETSDAPDPVVADDKVALSQTVVRVGDGITREKYGTGETDATLPDELEFVFVQTGGGSTLDAECWVVLHD